MRALKDEQNSAYNKSLNIDKEKLKFLKCKMDSEVTRESGDNGTESEMHIPTAETEIEEYEHHHKLKLDERVTKALLDLEEEPIASDDNFRFQFLFPDGRTRKIRTFSPDSTTTVRTPFSL